MRDIPTDQEILDHVNQMARLLVNAEMEGEHVLPEGFRCDMSRVGFIRRRWERAAKVYKKRWGLDPHKAIARIEADLRSPTNAPALHVERR